MATLDNTKKREVVSVAGLPLTPKHCHQPLTDQVPKSWKLITISNQQPRITKALLAPLLLILIKKEDRTQKL